MHFYGDTGFWETEANEARDSKCFFHSVKSGRPGNIGAKNYQSPRKKFSLCFLGSHVIEITETRR